MMDVVYLLKKNKTVERKETCMAHFSHIGERSYAKDILTVLIVDKTGSKLGKKLVNESYWSSYMTMYKGLPAVVLDRDTPYLLGTFLAGLIRIPRESPRSAEIIVEYAEAGDATFDEALVLGSSNLLCQDYDCQVSSGHNSFYFVDYFYGYNNKMHLVEEALLSSKRKLMDEVSWSEQVFLKDYLKWVLSDHFTDLSLFKLKGKDLLKHLRGVYE